MTLEREHRAKAKSSAIAWIGALAVSAVIVLSFELNRHHYAASKVSARVGAAILIWLALAVIFRFVVFVVKRLMRGSPQSAR
jgi:hypothetical protein